MLEGRQTSTREAPRQAAGGRAAWVRYGAAVALVALGVPLTYALQTLLGGGPFRIPFALFFAVVVVATWFGGRGPGLLSVLLSALASAYLFVPPTYSLKLGPDGAIQVAVFLFVSVLLSSLLERSRRAEAEARAGGEWLRTTLRSIGDAVIATDAEGRVVFMNPAAQILTGWREAEARGRDLAEVFRIVNEETREPVESPVRKVISVGTVVGLANHTVLVARDGREIPIDDSGAPIRDEEGRLIGVALVFHDIAERRRAEAAARAQERRLALVFNSAADSLFLLTAEDDDTFRFLSVNEAFTRVTGLKQEEIVGRRVEEVLPESSHALVLGKYREALSGNRSVRWEEVAEFPAGRRVGEVVVTPMQDEADGRRLLVGSIHDLTGAREAEDVRNLFAAIVESSNDAILGKTLDGRITSWNEGAQRMYGYTAGEVVGRHVSVLAPPERAEEINHFLDAIRRGERVEQRETVRRRKDGTLFHASLTISPIKDASGRVVGASTIARNISEQKRAEEERARLAARVEGERARLNNLLTNVPGIVWEAWGEPDASSQRINFVSDYVETMLGYSVEEWLAAPNFWLTIVHEEDRERAAREAHAIFESGAGGTSRFRWVAKDGRVVPVEARSKVVCDERGRPVGMRGVTMDISERVRAEEERELLLARERAARAEAEASEQRYRYLADSMPQIVWTARPDGWTDYFNRRWFDYTGQRPGEGGGWGWQTAVHPEDAERCLRRWARSVQTGDDFEIEYRLRRGSDGAYRWHLARAKPMRDAAGYVVKWFGTATDIEDQKHTEESLRFLAEADAILASSLDFELTLEAVARLAVPRMADYCLVDLLGPQGEIRRAVVAHSDPAKESAWREMQRRFPLDPELPYTIPKVLRTGRPELYSNMADDTFASALDDAEQVRALQQFGIRSSMIVPLLARGRTIGAISFIAAESARQYAAADLAFAEDLARRAAIAIDNAQLYRRMEEANRAKDEFLATLSHELRTPLTPVIGWVHMLRAGRLPPSETPHGLAVIEKNSQMLARLINDLLDMSAILSGKMRIEHAPVELDSVLREAVETARTSADQQGVGLELSLAPADGGPPRTVSGDRMRLVQVFGNLLNNAIKFSARGKRVRVLCESDEREARVRVSDEGQGIAPEFLPQVFERFRQGDQSTTRKHGGLGIGLALVKSFVEAHGGRAEAESDGLGLGSSFNVVLPLAQTSPPAQTKAETPAEAHAEARPQTPAEPLTAEPSAAPAEAHAATHAGPPTETKDAKDVADAAPSAEGRAEADASAHEVCTVERAVPETVPEGAGEASSGDAPTRPAPGVRRVLVVEDARDTLELLEALFAARGYEATLCETAGEALRVAPSTWFDIIISDIGLPQIDGYELIRRLRQMPHLRGVPAVALTGYAAQKDADAALLAGFDLHIPKPVDPNQLADALERLVRQTPRDTPADPG